MTLLRVEYRSAGLTVTGFYRERLAAGALVERQIAEPAALAEQLAAAVASLGGGSGVRAAIAVPTAAAISKRLEMPAELTESQLEELLGFEIEQHSPYPSDEICWDFTRAAPIADSAHTAVELVACRREYVEARRDLLSSAGREPVLIDVENFALQRAFVLLKHQLSESAEVVALVDIGEQAIALTVMLRGELLYSRDQPRADDRQGVQSLVEQIARELQFFYASSPYNFVDQLFICGALAADPALAAALAERTQLTCTVAEPLAGVAVAGTLQRAPLAAVQSGLLIAIGLAVGGDGW
jgi:type IV pilus assembly protein PilM